MKSQALKVVRARIYSLIEMARANGIEPYTYMVEVLTKLPPSTTEKTSTSCCPYGASNQTGGN